MLAVLGGRGLQMKAVEGGGTPYTILTTGDIVVPTDYALDGTAILYFQVRDSRRGRTSDDFGQAGQGR